MLNVLSFFLIWCRYYDRKDGDNRFDAQYFELFLNHDDTTFKKNAIVGFDAQYFELFLNLDALIDYCSQYGVVSMLNILSFFLIPSKLSYGARKIFVSMLNILSFFLIYLKNDRKKTT